MAAKTYTVLNGPAPGAAATPKVATGAAVKTLIQIAANATNPAIRFTEWWFEGDASTAATPGQIELLRLDATTPATVTAYVAADIAKANDPNAPAASIQLGTALSGYTASAEGTLVNPVSLSQQLAPPTSGFYIQFPLNREPEINVNKFARLRVTFGSTVNAICGLTWEE